MIADNPQLVASGERSQDASPQLPHIGDRPPRVLIVDDLMSNTVLLADILQHAGAETLIAASGAEALAVAESRGPDLVLLDLYMPDMSGVETCRRIQSSEWGRNLPVIFVTGASGKENIVTALSAGGVDYLAKPVSSEELLARIGVQLRLRQAEFQLAQRNQQLMQAAASLERTNAQLAQLSRVDGLTNIFNRRAWDAEAQKEHRRAVRQNLVYAVAMVDIDFFKAYNDFYGHQAGDDCLRAVASAISGMLRDTDVVGRYGGEEFVVLLPDTPGSAATEIAERIRECIWNLRLTHEKSPVNRVTVSIGVADSRSRDLDDTIRAADKLLYIAKRSGRNVVQGKPSVSCETKKQSQTTERSGQGSAFLHQVLLISNDPACGESLIAALGTHGVRVETVPGDRFLAKPDAPPEGTVVLLDLHQPGAPAERIVKALRETTLSCPVPIMGICRPGTVDSEAAVRLGLEDVLDASGSTASMLLRLRSMAQLSHERRSLDYTYRLRGEQVRGLTTLVEVACRLAASRSYESLLEILLKGATDVLASDHAVIAILGHDGTIKQVTRWDGRNASTEVTREATLEESAIARRLATEEIIVENPSADDPGGYPRLHARLESHGLFVGCLSIARRLEKSPMTEQDVEFAKLYVSLMSSTLLEFMNHEARDHAVGAFVRAMALTAELHDSDTAQHVSRVAILSEQLSIDLRERAGRVEITDAFIRDLKLAAPLHDIGKLSIPGDILKKPGTLTLSETAIVRMHCDLGAEIFSKLLQDHQCMSFARMATDVIMGHHERFDGGGYPRGLAGEQIPLAARIVAVADAYDAITSDRVYRKARSHDDAVAILRRGSGTQFDPAVIEAFLRREPQIRAWFDSDSQ